MTDRSQPCCTPTMFHTLANLCRYATADNRDEMVAGDEPLLNAYSIYKTKYLSSVEKLNVKPMLIEHCTLVLVTVCMHACLDDVERSEAKIVWWE